MTTLYIQEFRTEEVLFTTENFNTVPRLDEDIFIEGTWYRVKEVNHYYRHLNTMDGNSVTVWVERLLDAEDHERGKGTPLMEKPTDEDIARDPSTSACRLSELDHATTVGRDMENDEYNSWHFPKGVKEKIKPDGKYLIYYKWRDSADSFDSTTFYHVYYIEEL